MLANWAYFRVLSPAEVGAHKLVAAEMMQRIMGPVGASAVSVAAMISIFAALNGSILTGARVPFAAARDGLFFRSAAWVHPAFRTPGVSILMLTAWSAVAGVIGKIRRAFHICDICQLDSVCDGDGGGFCSAQETSGSSAGI